MTTRAPCPRRRAHAAALQALLLVAWGGVSVPSPAEASVVEPLDVAALSARAERVVEGEVVAMRSAWDARRQRIHTRIEVRVTAAWKGPGAPGDRVVVRQLGGAVDGLSQYVVGAPSFALGERVVLFLVAAPAGTYAVLGQRQGKYTVSPEGLSPEGVSPEGVSPEGVSPEGVSPEVSTAVEADALAAGTHGPGRKGPAATLPTALDAAGLAALRAQLRAALPPSR